MKFYWHQESKHNLRMGLDIEVFVMMGNLEWRENWVRCQSQGVPEGCESHWSRGVCMGRPSSGLDAIVGSHESP